MEKHRVIMIHLIVGGILVMILMIHMHGKEAQIFYILDTFLISLCILCLLHLYYHLTQADRSILVLKSRGSFQKCRIALKDLWL